jgi:hypothetical protein
MGAGASKPLGYPLTSEILPAIRDELKNKTTLFGGSPSERQATEDLKRLLNLLLPGFHDESLKLPLVTDILSLIDHSLTAGGMLIPGKTSTDLVNLRRLLERAILNVIESGEDYTDREQPVLDAFCKWLSTGRIDGIISTNYDIAIERELFKPYGTHQGVSRDFDFGIRWRDPNYSRLYQPPADPRFKFYKLHGSLNWLRCECCEHVYINTYGEIGVLAYEEASEANLCDCGHAPLSTVLVAPRSSGMFATRTCWQFGSMRWNCCGPPTNGSSSDTRSPRKISPFARCSSGRPTLAAARIVPESPSCKREKTKERVQPISCSSPNATTARTDWMAFSAWRA